MEVGRNKGKPKEIVPELANPTHLFKNDNKFYLM